MALRLRRGTDAERLLITPLQGELIYTTDTKLLYVGDGSTAGGTLVTGAGGGGSTTLDALTDTNLSGAETGDVLSYNAGTNKWEPAEIPGLASYGLNDLAGVTIDENTLATGDILKVNSFGEWTPQPISEVFAEGQHWRINVIGNDSTVLVDSDNSTLGGTLLGSVIGDMKGSVFSDDSTLLVDGINGTLTNGTIIIDNDIISTFNRLTISNNFSSDELLQLVTVKSNVLDIISDRSTFEGAAISTSTSNGTIDAPTGLTEGDTAGAIVFNAYKTSLSDYRGNAGIAATIDTVTGTDDIPGKLNVFVRDPDGNIAFPFSINSRGVAETPVFKTTPFADATARDAAIPTPEAGMLVYITSTNKHQGYNGTSWNDLY
jgi:hypothetical protein